MTGAIHITDRGLAPLAGGRLNALHVTDTWYSRYGDESALTSACFEHIRGGIRVIKATGLRIIDDAHFEHLTGIQVLDISNSRVSDVGLSHIIGIKILNVSGCDVSDAGLALLSGLRHLNVEDCENFTGSCLAALGTLETLNAESTKLDDAGLRLLFPSTRMRGLNVAYTCVSDLGIHGLCGLRRLDICGCDNVNGYMFAEFLPRLRYISAQDSSLGGTQELMARGVEVEWRARY